MMQKSVRSYLHVAIQFSAIFYFIFELNRRNLTTERALLLPGILLGLWAVWVMRYSVFSVFPEPNNKSILLQKGPYRIIRHPMYTALFLVFIPITVFQFSYFNLAVFLVFTINQIFKLLFEEQMLGAKFADYKSYREKTWRLIPYVF